MVRSIEEAQKAIESALEKAVEPSSVGRSLWIKGNLAFLAGDAPSLITSFQVLRERGGAHPFHFPRCTPSQGLVKTIRDGKSFSPVLVTNDLLDQAIEVHSHILRVYGPLPRVLFFRANLLKCKVTSNANGFNSTTPHISLPLNICNTITGRPSAIY